MVGIFSSTLYVPITGVSDSIVYICTVINSAGTSFTCGSKPKKQLLLQPSLLMCSDTVRLYTTTLTNSAWIELDFFAYRGKVCLFCYSCIQLISTCLLCVRIHMNAPHCIRMHCITPGPPYSLTVSSSPVSAPAAEGVPEKSVLTWKKRLGLVMGCGNGEGGGGVLELPRWLK